ncbi:hypothetical protein KDX27_41255 [Burkholderia cenocepacia]|uniref:hypothetical protein n=1 Tax=Burkholderia cenocepacia TaxID=95486 RepID=UPI001B9988C6|nr:hypothetical protein [Burkholderia cenocepacia]MBR8030110.1 hypothetical protein [Burkholderia cenocepacia]MBR8174100.1 hypothetical protein [Burkholderia cenocepacia]
MSFGLARGNTDLLFCKVDWFSVEQHQRSAVDQEVDAYHPDKLLNTSEDALVDYFVEKYRMDVPQIQRDAISVDQRETRIDVSEDPSRYVSDRSRPFHVPGTLVEVEIPFLGDEQFFGVQPSTFTLNPPRGEVRGGSLFIHVQGTTLQPAQVKQHIDSTVADIQTNLNHLRSAAEQFNRSIVSQIQSKIAFRKQKLLQDRNLVASLGFPMKQRDGAAGTYASPQVRRKITPSQPAASTASFTPEPALPDDHYNAILDIMTNMVRVMECSPSAFAHSDEEAIRTHFLVQLNGHYQGQATGETFNYEGKTDILVKDKGRSIFVAECKFWRGEKGYLETIDQLLGYLTWRDTKAAILVFNRNRNFTDVLAKVKEITERHPNFRKFIMQRSETGWMFRFAHRDDPNREMTVTVMVFDVPHVA